MKKICIAAIAAVLFAFQSFAQSTLIFDAPHSLVIDGSEIPGKCRDNISLTNLTQQENLSFTVHFYDERKKTWVNFGSILIEDFGDTETIDSHYSGFLKKVRYFAVQSNDDMDFSVIAAKNRNDLLIFIVPAQTQTPVPPKTAVLDSSAVAGNFKDRLRLISEGITSKTFFYVYGSNDENAWSLAGAAVLVRDKDTCYLKTPFAQLSSYRFFAVADGNGNFHTCNAYKTSNDLYIMVSPEKAVPQTVQSVTQNLTMEESTETDDAEDEIFVITGEEEIENPQSASQASGKSAEPAESADGKNLFPELFAH